MLKRSRKIRQGTKLDYNGLDLTVFNCFDLVDESLVRFMWVTEVLHDLCYQSSDRIDEKEVLCKMYFHKHCDGQNHQGSLIMEDVASDVFNYGRQHLY